MTPIETWLVLTIVSTVLGITMSIKSRCLDMEVTARRTVCRRRIRWIEWIDVTPKFSIAMIMTGGAVWAWWGLREVLLERGLRFTELEAIAEYVSAWGGFLTFATGVVILSLFLLTQPLRE